MHAKSHRVERFRLLTPQFVSFLLLSLVAAFCMTGCAAKKSPSAGPFTPGDFVSSEGKPLDARALAAALSRADYVLVGETHDNPLDHRAQAALIDVLAASGYALAIGLEMLPHGRFDAALRRFTEGELALEELPSELDWQRSWGYDFALYRPVFEAAARHGLPVFGLNIENDMRRAVSRKGLEGLTLAETKGLPLAIIAPLPAHEARLSAFFSEHSAMIGKAKEKPDAGGRAPMPGAAMRARLLLIQSLWDSVMAEQAARVRRETGRRVVVLAGSGHVENGYGIAHRLRVYDPDALVMTVASFSGTMPESGAGSVYFYSPERKRFGLRFSGGTGAPVIESVLPGSAAEKAGLKAGDKVVGAAGEPVATARDLHRIAVAAGGRGAPLALEVERPGGRITIQLE